MNKACISCGQIVTVPDVPLPSGYTQRCPACGYDNPVSDDYEEGPIHAASPGGDEDATGSWGSNLDQTMDEILVKRGAGDLEKSVSGNDDWSPESSMDDLLVTKNEHVPDPVLSNHVPLEQSLNEMEARLRNGLLDTLGQSAAEIQNKIYEQLSRAFSERLADLETQIRAGAAASAAAAPPAPQTDPTGPDLNRFVSVNQALVVTQHPAVYRTCESQLVKMGFSVQGVQAMEPALNAFRKTQFQVLVLDQKLLSAGEEGKRVLAHLKNTKIEIRRCQSVVLISPSIASGEPQVFYQWGIDMNIHPKDLERFEEFLSDLLATKNQLLTSLA